jgi:hypothetical protein
VKVSRRAWLAAPWLFALAFAVINWTYWPMVVRAGGAMPDARPAAANMLDGLFVAPILGLLMWVWSRPAYSGAPERIDPLVHGSGRRAMLGNLLYGGVATIAFLLALTPFLPGGELVDAVWLVWLIPLAAWSLLLRAAYLLRPSND